MNRYSDDHDGYCDMRADAEELRRDDIACVLGLCEQCGCDVPVVEVFDAEIGFEEQARPVVVTVLDCGHEMVRAAVNVWAAGRMYGSGATT